MSLKNIIHAWKSESFRNSLSDEERALLPENPAGLIELTNAQLDQAAGGIWSSISQCHTQCSIEMGLC
jgi:mersacidin/lichenicidin family type 2 lantibiotic